MLAKHRNGGFSEINVPVMIPWSTMSKNVTNADDIFAVASQIELWSTLNFCNSKNPSIPLTLEEGIFYANGIKKKSQLAVFVNVLSTQPFMYKKNVP